MFIGDVYQDKVSKTIENCTDLRLELNTVIPGDEYIFLLPLMSTLKPLT